MMYRRMKTVLIGTGMCLAMFRIQPSFAQLSPQADQLGEVVVTATRREANIQDVPISIHAMTNADLARDQVGRHRNPDEDGAQCRFQNGPKPV